MNSFIFKFFSPLKTFAWKILHGRVKARPSGQNTPVTPWEWLDDFFPSGATQNRIRSSLDCMFQDTLVPWTSTSLTNDFKSVFFLCQDAPGDVVVSEKNQKGDLIVCTDGSFQNDRLGFSFCLFDKEECLTPIMEYHALLTPCNTIPHAEATALICSLNASLALPHTGSIYLSSDCLPALRLFLDMSSSCPLS